MSDFELPEINQSSMVLDKNRELIGFTNGVLEVFDHHVLFRPAKPEDHISMNFDYAYYEEETEYHKNLVRENMKWIDQIFPDIALRHQFFNVAASWLKGFNSNATGATPQLARTKSPPCCFHA